MSSRRKSAGLVRLGRGESGRSGRVRSGQVGTQPLWLIAPSFHISLLLLTLASATRLPGCWTGRKSLQPPPPPPGVSPARRKSPQGIQYEAKAEGQELGGRA